MIYSTVIGGILVSIVAGIIAILIGRIPYLYLDESAMRQLAVIERSLKRRLANVSSDDTYIVIQKQIVSIRLQKAKRLCIPIILQFVVVTLVYKFIASVNPVYLWQLWYLLSIMVFGWIFRYIG